jgi:hypothetical protein
MQVTLQSGVTKEARESAQVADFAWTSLDEPKNKKEMCEK